MCVLPVDQVSAMNLECQILNDKKHVKEFFENVCQKYLYKYLDEKGIHWKLLESE